MVSLKSTKRKMTDNFSEDFRMMKGQHVAGRAGSSATLSHPPPPNLQGAQHGLHQRARLTPVEDRWRGGDLRRKLGGQPFHIHPLPHNLTP